MKTCHKVSDVLIGVVDNVLHHFVGYEKFKTFNWRFRSLGSSSRSFCTPQYVLVCSSATNSSFFLCMPLPGEFLVCTRIVVRWLQLWLLKVWGLLQMFLFVLIHIDNEKGHCIDNMITLQERGLSSSRIQVLVDKY